MHGRPLALRLLALFFVLSTAAGCASSFMVPADTMSPGPNFAVVNFLRPSSFGGAIKFGVWDREEVVGVLTPKNYIQYKASPGEHIFMVRAENWSVIKANVQAGKNYYVLAEPRMGLMKARVALTVLQPTDSRIEKWMRDLKPIMMDPAQRDAYVADHREGVEKAVQNIDAGDVDMITLKPSDGK